MKAAAIIVSAGQGRRMGNINKQFLELCGWPVIGHVLDTFLACPEVTPIVLVVPKDEMGAYGRWLEDNYGYFEDIHLVEGGPERQYSVFNGLRVLPEDSQLVAIHDGARPLVDVEIIKKTLETAQQWGAAVAAVPVKETIKRADDQGFVECTLERATLWTMQTPQSFRYDIIMKAHQLAAEQGYLGTDDAVLVERAGYKVKLILSSYDNIKITTPDDVPIAQELIKRKKPILDADSCPKRAGIGYDVHRLVESRALILGGVNIPSQYGLLGHSDADVLVHAIMDALLGAAALGDIGRHFPDNDQRYKDICSLKLLEQVNALLNRKGCFVNNIDAVITAQQPRLAPYIWAMRRNIAAALGISVRHINVKATTTEGLGFEGRQEGISAQAIATVLTKP